MIWDVEYLPEAIGDLRKLDGSQRLLVRKAIRKVQGNPLPSSQGGYGKPLGNKGGTTLSGYLKVKIRSAGLRIVYQLREHNGKMLVIIIGARADDEVYELANQRIEKHGL